jgi:acyl-coenzyme A synthetase/AMP-(fatty) acid ligase
LVLLGRKDSQVKIRGYRVELDEIESILKMHSGVQDAVVITTVNHAGEKELLAAVIPLPESNPEQTELLKHCRNILPPYAVPQRILVIQDFPRTRSEKIDRRQIKELLSEQTYE